MRPGNSVHSNVRPNKRSVRLPPMWRWTMSQRKSKSIRTSCSMLLGRYTSASSIAMPVGRASATTGQVSPCASNAARRADRCSATPPCGGGNGPSCNTLIASLRETSPADTGRRTSRARTSATGCRMLVAFRALVRLNFREVTYSCASNIASRSILHACSVRADLSISKLPMLARAPSRAVTCGRSPVLKPRMNASIWAI